MPPGLNDEIRAFVAKLDRRDYPPEKAVWSATGYVQVIKVKKRFQARLQVPGDGPGGECGSGGNIRCRAPSTMPRVRPSTWRG